MTLQAWDKLLIKIKRIYTETPSWWMEDWRNGNRIVTGAEGNIQHVLQAHSLSTIQNSKSFLARQFGACTVLSHTSTGLPSKYEKHDGPMLPNTRGIDQHPLRIHSLRFQALRGAHAHSITPTVALHWSWSCSSQIRCRSFESCRCQGRCSLRSWVPSSRSWFACYRSCDSLARSWCFPWESSFLSSSVGDTTISSSTLPSMVHTPILCSSFSFVHDHRFFLSVYLLELFHLLFLLISLSDTF